MANLIERAEAKVSFRGTRESINVIDRALAPEIESPPTDRSDVEISVRDDTAVLKIVAKDIPALRAALSSYLTWVTSILNTLTVAEELK